MGEREIEYFAPSALSIQLSPFSAFTRNNFRQITPTTRRTGVCLGYMHFCSDCQWHKIETRMNFSVPTLLLLGVFLDRKICIQSHIFQLLRLPPDSSSCLCSYSISGFCKRRIALTCIYAHFGDEEVLMAPMLLVNYEWELCSFRGLSSSLASFIADECFRNRTPRRLRPCPLLPCSCAQRPPPGCHRLIVVGGFGQRLLFSGRGRLHCLLTY